MTRMMKSSVNTLYKYRFKSCQVHDIKSAYLCAFAHGYALFVSYSSVAVIRIWDQINQIRGILSLVRTIDVCHLINILCSRCCGGFTREISEVAVIYHDIDHCLHVFSLCAGIDQRVCCRDQCAVFKEYSGRFSENITIIMH